MYETIRTRSSFGSRNSIGSLQIKKSSVISLKNEYINGLIHQNNFSGNSNGNGNLNISRPQSHSKQLKSYHRVNVQNSPYSKKQPRKSLGDVKFQSKQRYSNDLKNYQTKRVKVFSKGQTIVRTKSKQLLSSRQHFQKQLSNNPIGVIRSYKTMNLKVNGQKVANLYQTKKGKQRFKILAMIGKGGFGKVWKVMNHQSGKLYALKQISKATVITKKSMESIINQRNLLAVLKNNFIVSMVQAFQQELHLYILMSLMQGGDLRYHICKNPEFQEQQIRFIVACIVVALQYLHGEGIMHRDIKPQNIVFDQQGYAMLTDMGIAKYQKGDNSNCTSGTPGYMAPQVMFNRGHSFESDFYALGVIVYELMMKKRPYLGRNRAQIKEQIKSKQVLIPKRDIPDGFSVQIADFVNKTLQRQPLLRLGWGSIKQIKNHSWLKDFPWKMIQNKKLQSPFQRKYNPAQVRYRPTQHDTQYIKNHKENYNSLCQGKFQGYFMDYTYDEDVLKSIEEHSTVRTLIK